MAKNNEETFTSSQIKYILQIQENTIINFIKIKMNMELVNEKVDRLSKEIFQEIGGIKKDVADLKTSISFTQTTLEEKVRKVEEY